MMYIIEHQTRAMKVRGDDMLLKNFIFHLRGPYAQRRGKNLTKESYYSIEEAIQ